MRLLPRLIDKAHELGFEITLGDAYRDPRVHGVMGVRASYSHPKSAHKIRLAIDLNLFKDGQFLEQSTDHQQLGEWWESQGSDHRCCASYERARNATNSPGSSQRKGNTGNIKTNQRSFRSR